MDYSHGNELFQWQEGDSFLDKDSTLDISDLTWDGDTQDEDFSYILEETTPVKDCGDNSYHFGSYGEKSKDSDECQASSRVKRRRILQFDDEDLNLTFQSDDYAFLMSKESINVIEEGFSQTSKQGVGFQEVPSSSELELGCLDQVEDWLGFDCFNYSETHNNSAHMNSCGTNDLLIDITDLMSSRPKVAANTIPKQTVKTWRNVVFKGTKSYMRTPTKIGSSVAYPFTFIKPSGVNGDMTLKEINERIRTPPPMKPKASIYETSTFSGKPVVNKARIRTEGGQGSITIMRTQG